MQEDKNGIRDFDGCMEGIRRQSDARCTQVRSTGPQALIVAPSKQFKVEFKTPLSMLDAVLECAETKRITSGEDIKFDFSFVPKIFFEQPKVILIKDELSQRLDKAMENRMAGADVPAAPLRDPAMEAVKHRNAKTIFEIVGLKNDSHYNGCMGRVLRDSEHEGRWDIEIAAEGERKILAIRPNAIQECDAGDQRATETAKILDDVLIGDTVRFYESNNKEWAMGRVTRVLSEVEEEEGSLSFSETAEESLSLTETKIEARRFLIAPCSPEVDSATKCESEVELVTLEEITTMEKIQHDTKRLEDNIKAYLTSLTNGSVCDIREATTAQMNKILEAYDDYKGIDLNWRKRDQIAKLEGAITQIDEMLSANINKARAKFARAALKTLVNGLSYAKALDEIAQEDEHE